MSLWNQKKDQTDLWSEMLGKHKRLRSNVSERMLRFTRNGDEASKLCSRVLVASGIDFPLSGFSTLQSWMWQVGKWNSSFWCVQPGVIPSVFIPSVTSEIPLTCQFKKHRHGSRTRPHVSGAANIVESWYSGSVRTLFKSILSLTSVENRGRQMEHCGVHG